MNNTREHILDTAANLFLQKSYHEVTMQDIVVASGLSKGAFYHHFRSKEHLFEEVIDSFFSNSSTDDFSQFSQTSLQDFCRDYERMVAERVRQHQARTGDASGVLRANQHALVFEAMKMLPRFRDKQQQRQQRELAAWLRVIAQARQSREITSPLEDGQIARLFIYQNYGIGAYYMLRTQIEELTQEVSAQFAALYQALR